MPRSFAASDCSASDSGSSSCSADSLFSTLSTSTAASDIIAVPERPNNPVRLPLKLPPAPSAAHDVDLSSLVVDEEIKGLPLGLVVGKLQSMGDELLRLAGATHLSMPTSQSVPAKLTCHLPPSINSIKSTLPSHVLAIRTGDSPRTLLLPVHGVLWAAKSPALAILSSSPGLQPPSTHLDPKVTYEANELPVLQMTLPSSSTIPILNQYLYTSSRTRLLSSLLPSPLPATSFDLVQSLSHVAPSNLLRSINRVHGLWQNVVALEMADEGVWDAMDQAWTVLVAALIVRERRNTASATSSVGGGVAGIGQAGN
ncbi:hypothetical protein T439DRAFT_384310 [Meredithblackwellia eburnea MCA 4105]